MTDNLNNSMSQSDSEKTIRDLIDRWMVATKNGDGDAIVDLMCDDVIFTVPNQAPFGKDEFVDGFRQLAEMDFEGKSEILEIEVFGDHAFTRTLVEITINTPDGQRIEKRARTLTIYKREQDGAWRLYRDANLPA